MEFLDYEKLKNMINAYLEERCRITEDVVSKEKISYYLETVIRRRELDVNEIHNLSIIRTFDMDIFYYTVRKADKMSSNILVTKDERKLFSIEKSSEQSSSVNNYDSMFCAYDPSTNKIEKKMRFQKLDINGTIVNKVIVLDKIPDSLEYNRKEYKIYIQSGKILCVKRGKDEYYLDDTGVDFMLDNTFNIIENESQNITFRLCDILHKEKVKEYKIKKRNSRVLMKVQK